MTDKKPDNKTSLEVNEDTTENIRSFVKKWEDATLASALGTYPPVSSTLDLTSLKTYADQYNLSFPTTYTIPTPNPQWTVTPNWNQNVYTTLNHNYNTYQVSPRLTKTDCKVEVTMDDGKVESITREDLIKYIYEQKLVRENEVVRKVYERYQVAVKLVRSDDDGDTGV